MFSSLLSYRSDDALYARSNQEEQHKLPCFQAIYIHVLFRGLYLFIAFSQIISVSFGSSLVWTMVHEWRQKIKKYIKGYEPLVQGITC